MKVKNHSPPLLYKYIGSISMVREILWDRLLYPSFWIPFRAHACVQPFVEVVFPAEIHEFRAIVFNVVLVAVKPPFLESVYAPFSSGCQVRSYPVKPSERRDNAFFARTFLLAAAAA